MIDWKCVTKCLPEEDEKVLVCIQYLGWGNEYTYKEGYFSPYEGWIYSKENLCKPKIVAWAVLPELPNFVEKPQPKL